MEGELIVTQWDVNNDDDDFQIKEIPELIVTQWDVNMADCSKTISA